MKNNRLLKGLKFIRENKRYHNRRIHQTFKRKVTSRPVHTVRQRLELQLTVVIGFFGLYEGIHMVK